MGERLNSKKALSWAGDNAVTLVFVAFTVLGFMASNLSVGWFVSELMGRLYRNAFLVISLIIPVIAGLGLNFGIVVGAMAGQIAIVAVRFVDIGGLGGLMLAFLISTPVAILFGWLTGLLYNKTRGQEMIASLIVGFFANGIYQFLFLFVMGVIIKVPSTHPLIIPSAVGGEYGVGIRVTVDLGAPDKGGLKYALDNIAKIPFLYAIIAIAALILVLQIVRIVRSKKSAETRLNKLSTISNIVISLVLSLLQLFLLLQRTAFPSLLKFLLLLLSLSSLCVSLQNGFSKQNLVRTLKQLARARKLLKYPVSTLIKHVSSLLSSPQYLLHGARLSHSRTSVLSIHTQLILR